MTCAELIERLREFPPDADVIVLGDVGCDVVRVWRVPGDDDVLLSIEERPPEPAGEGWWVVIEQGQSFTPPPRP